MYYTVSNQREGNHTGMAVSTLSMRLMALPRFILTLHINLRLRNKEEIWKEKIHLRQENQINLVATLISQVSAASRAENSQQGWATPVLFKNSMNLNPGQPSCLHFTLPGIGTAGLALRYWQLYSQRLVISHLIFSSLPTWCTFSNDVQSTGKRGFAIALNAFL